MASADLLFEIGTEEIPAGFLAKAIVDLEAIAKERLKQLRLAHGTVSTLGTPRRVTLAVAGLADRQTDVSEVVTGPPASAAFDKEGKPTKAAIGLAAKSGLPVDQLKVVEVPGKGAYVAANREEKGAETRALLPKLLGEIARAIPWKKSMRWASFDEPFVRPVHWMVALYGGEVVPLDAYGVKSGRDTRGHRFLAPGAIILDGTLADYTKKLGASFVIVDLAARRTMVEAELARAQEEHGLRVRRDDDLIAEVTNLLEYPQAIVGAFDEAYLELPPEVIVSTIRAHLRYFATEAADGKLSNRFVTIAGTVTRDAKVVQRGNEMVVRPRLSDAQFFFREDRKKNLVDHGKRLSEVVFQAKLGTIGEKVERIRAHAQLAALGGAHYAHGAAIMKADLTTKMVGEFPDLQGIMGSYYARLDGEPADVVDAIREHYLPRGATDALPQGTLGAALGVADRLDTIVGCFAVGLAPTGSTDAFGLRRAALAILNLMLARGWKQRVGDLVDESAKHLAAKITWTAELRTQVLEFVKTRLRGLLVDGRGLAADCVDAALAAGFEDVPDAAARATAVAHLRDRPDFEPLGVAFKRVANILKGEAVGGEPDRAQFKEPSETALWDAYAGVRDRVAAALAKHEYDAALRELTTIKPAVDKFFDDVLVMDKDPAIKANRLALLGTINATFMKIADFRQLAVAQDTK